jgi:hypothetical protein
MFIVLLHANDVALFTCISHTTGTRIVLWRQILFTEILVITLHSRHWTPFANSVSHGSRRSIFEKCDCKRRYSRYYKPPKSCGIVWKRDQWDIYSLAPLDEETALCRLFRVLAYKAFGMMTSQSLSKQPLMCRQNHTYQLLSPSRTNPATSWTASAAEKIPRIRDQVSKSCQPEFCNQKLQILHFENLCLLLRVYEKPTSNRRQFRPWGRDPTSFKGMPNELEMRLIQGQDDLVRHLFDVTKVSKLSVASLQCRFGWDASNSGASQRGRPQIRFYSQRVATSNLDTILRR